MRVTYPLTESARRVAGALVQEWQRTDQQMFAFAAIRGGIQIVGTGRWQFTEFSPASLRELAHFGLLELSRSQDTYWEVLLLQELINAVENAFAVSDYFLTMQAVGTVIVSDGDLTITAPVQGAASVYGSVTQSYEEIAESLRDTLGEELLATHQTLAEAIDGLTAATQKDDQSKLGKVISELGRCFEHGANAAAVSAALVSLAPFVNTLVG